MASLLSRSFRRTGNLVFASDKDAKAVRVQHLHRGLEVMALAPGLKHQTRAVVDSAHAIDFMGSHVPRVLATPALIMYLEMASRDLAKQHLDAGYDTVGTHVDVKHLAATPIGMAVTYLRN